MIDTDLLLCVICNRPNGWLLSICQINSHNAHFCNARLRVKFFLVCKISYRWGRLSGWCCAYLFRWLYWWPWHQYCLISLIEVLWSNGCQPKCQICKFAWQGTGNVSWIRPFLWCHVIASLSSVWDVSQCYQSVNLYLSGSTRANLYFVQRWLCVKLRFNCWSSNLNVLSWRTLHSIVPYDWMRSIEGFVFDCCVDVCWHTCVCLCWFCTRLTRRSDMLCVVFGAGKAHKKDKGIYERQNKTTTKTKILFCWKRLLIERPEKGTVKAHFVRRCLELHE